MKKALPNQSCVPSWDTDASDTYVRECYKLYHKKWSERYTLGDSYYGPHEKRWHRGDWKYHYTGANANWMHIEKLYREGRARKVLACDFDQFAHRVIKGYHPGRYFRRSYLDAPFRNRHEQVNWKDKGKKNLSEKEQAKRDWRKHKQISRDKKQASYTRSAPKWIKRYSQKLHRSWQNQNIAHENWEELMDDKKIKFCCDPWLWN